MKNALRIIPVLALGAALGCSTFSSLIKEPIVKFDSVRFTEASLNETTMLVALKVDNPNGFGLPLKTIRYDLKMRGRDLSSGEIEKGIDLPARETSTVELPIRLKYSQLFNSVIEMMREGKSPYQVTGDIGVGPFTIPFDRAGEVSLPSPKLR